MSVSRRRFLRGGAAVVAAGASVAAHAATSEPTVMWRDYVEIPNQVAAIGFWWAYAGENIIAVSVAGGETQIMREGNTISTRLNYRPMSLIVSSPKVREELKEQARRRLSDVLAGRAEPDDAIA